MLGCTHSRQVLSFQLNYTLRAKLPDPKSPAFFKFPAHCSAQYQICLPLFSVITPHGHLAEPVFELLFLPSTGLIGRYRHTWHILSFLVYCIHEVIYNVVIILYLASFTSCNAFGIYLWLYESGKDFFQMLPLFLFNHQSMTILVDSKPIWNLGVSLCD